MLTSAAVCWMFFGLWRTSKMTRAVDKTFLPTKNLNSRSIWPSECYCCKKLLNSVKAPWYAGCLCWSMFLREKKERGTFEPREILNFTGRQFLRLRGCLLSGLPFFSFVQGFCECYWQWTFCAVPCFHCKSNPKRSCCRSTVLFDLFVMLVLC